jgi:MFS family permease
MLTNGNARRSTLLVYLALILASYTTSAGITTLYSMLGLFYREFDNPLGIGWVITGYWLVACISAAICGRLGDVIGRRRMAFAILGIAGVGSVISAGAGGLNGLIVGCALQGTIGALTPLLMGMLREVMPRERVPFAIGVMAAAGTTGAGISFLLAGFVIDQYSWRTGFYMKATLVAATLLAMLAFGKAPAKKTASLAKVNVLAGIAFVPALAAIFASFQLAKGWGWSDPGAWGLLGLSVLTLIVWGRHQSRQANPLIDVRSLGHRPVLLANLIVGVLAVGCMQNGQVIALLLQQPEWTHIGFGMSATASGVLMLPLYAITLIGNPLGGSLTARNGARIVALIGFALITLGWAAIALFHQSLAFVVIADMGAVCGYGMAQSAAYITVVEATPADRTSEATGMTYVFLNTFIAIGAQAVFFLFAISTVKNPVRGAGTYPAESSYALAFLFIIATGLLGMVIACLLPRSAGALRGSAGKSREHSSAAPVTGT